MLNVSHRCLQSLGPFLTWSTSLPKLWRSVVRQAAAVGLLATSSSSQMEALISRVSIRSAVWTHAHTEMFKRSEGRSTALQSYKTPACLVQINSDSLLKHECSKIKKPKPGNGFKCKTEPLKKTDADSKFYSQIFGNDLTTWLNWKIYINDIRKHRLKRLYLLK